MLSGKYKRYNVVDLKNNHAEKFGRFIMALKHLEESDDWYRICGIHGDTFKPNDKKVLCPTDPEIVTAVGKTGEPFYCKHSVYSFIAWHTPYIYQFELLLNKYNKSSNKYYITLPYMDLTDTTVDFSFMNMDKITIQYENETIIVDNPLAGAYYYVDNMKTRTTRNGFLTPKTDEEKSQIEVVKKQLNNVLYASTYETFSSHPVQSKKIGLLTDYIPLETPHNSLHDIIGGTDGNMSDISISAFDPLFWLHHCNMDRHFYTWMYNNTTQFTKSIYPKKITKESYNATQAPFVPNAIYNTDSHKYKYGWRNQKFKYMLLKDMLKLEKYPFTYDIIEATPKVDTGSFVELIDILIPHESVKVNVYIIPKIVLKTKKVVKNSDYYAGTGFWFGVNRDKINCVRCNVTRTNMKIDICSYVKKNNITIDNINEYDIKIEATGLLIKINNLNKKYSQEELMKDASYKVVVTNV